MRIAEQEHHLPPAAGQEVQIPATGILLSADVSVPEDAAAVVIFAHGSGSSRHSARNRAVAKELNNQRCATVLVDLLTAEEEFLERETRHLRFDIPLLTQRLEGIVAWTRDSEETRRLPIGLFGTSTGAAAALITAAEMPSDVKAVVSRGGRPDLADGFLYKVQAPVLLIVGGNDVGVLKLNSAALEKLNDQSRIDIVSGATHLFEEMGALEEVARLSAKWFAAHMH